MNTSKHLTILLALFWAACSPKETTTQESSTAASDESLDIIAYYSGNGADISKYPIEKLDQIIYSFLHLKGNKLAIDNVEDSVFLLQITALKKQYPDLKVLVSLGGWGGCETCSPVFETEENRQAFAVSVVDILKTYDADGIDLDWEYPGIEGFPGHAYKPEDKQNFTALVRAIRTAMGNDYELSFAAGGFKKFLTESVEWDKVMPLLDRVNLMSYDLINGYSTETGHHTALYANPNQEVSTDFAVQYLDAIGVPLSKVVIGAAFYARIWENVPAENKGLYQSGTFLKGIGYLDLDSTLSADNGFEIYWDSTTHAPYAYSETLRQFVTYDNSQSLAAKVQYAKNKKLGGIMFWELMNDKKEDGLLDALYKATNK
ncbi:glycoside hydrolase family 18 protein [Reichenbachiella carrageenanivorans]|uniref:chitinase n=1 Tax=Reichenbachiella carrageenanivorans TaxID=2979869 RepID=A0ABY6D6W8_9BACT|nr:glycoside hydrolase family 18 protein [Reichenbachiella carrageenanivorans]UXX79580.1 glycoside hydrolase family 18 protein [Reichenbachiella carrageenanivorans]